MTTSRLTKSQSLVLRALSLYVDRHGATTSSLENLFQSLITLTEKKSFLLSRLKLPWCSFVLLPWVMSSSSGEKRLASASPFTLLGGLYRAMRPPFSFLFSRPASSRHSTFLLPDLLLLYGCCQAPQHLFYIVETRITLTTKAVCTTAKYSGRTVYSEQLTAVSCILKCGLPP